ncbi:hypothetical protein [Nonomuraea sp. NPDC049784]|uniref:hypothetical protein n=1 Tax=Nonomuraea sp. NPDC049784 TaxID=3154361 RepID=UPI003411C86C
MNDFDPEELERISARAEEMLTRVEELRNEIVKVAGRGEAADRQVRVTADASGRLVAGGVLESLEPSMDERLRAIEERRRDAR